MKNIIKSTGKIFNPRNRTKDQLQKHVMIEFVILVIVAIAFFVVVYNDYTERPGILNTDEIYAKERAVDSITVGWKQTRNIDNYYLCYKKRGAKYLEWNEVLIEANEDKPITSFKIEGLEEGTEYSFRMRADNDERQGFDTELIFLSTKSRQDIRIPHMDITKHLKSKNFKINAKAETKLSYFSDNNKVATVSKSGKVRINGPGIAHITVIAEANKDYIESKEVVRVAVFDSKPIDAKGAKAKVVYSLDNKNCEALFTVHSSGTPQSFAYTGDSYIVAYNGGFNGIITYSKSGKKISEHKTSTLGHANGLTYCNSTKLCYGMRGNSHRIDTYDPKEDKFGVADTTKYGGSGIAYDRIKNVLYMSYKTGMREISADGKFEYRKTTANATHANHVFTQDSGGHAGLVMRCMSGSNKHKTNYIDIYRMADAKYLGSVFCDIGEVESATVDDDGYMVLLINSASDYIWKTPINIETLAE